MLIKRQPSKRLAPAAPAVAELVRRACEASEEELIVILTPLCLAGYGPNPQSAWPLPRSDLFHWQPLLDRFDGLLEQTVQKYWSPLASGVLRVQSVEFEETLLLRILEFSRLLLEHCTSRNIYNSYERLRPLLTARSNEVLERCLELLMVPARKVEGQPSLRQAFLAAINLNEIALLAGLTPHSKPLKGMVAASASELEAFAAWHRLHHDAPTISQMLAFSIYLLTVDDEVLYERDPLSLTPTLLADTARLITATPTPPMVRGPGSL